MWFNLFLVQLCLLGVAQARDYGKGSLCFNNLDSFVKYNHGLRKNFNRSDGVCYRHLGCFNKQESELSFLGILPDSPEVVDAKFILYSNEMDKGTVISFERLSTLVNLKFLGTKPGWLTIIVHGFGSGIRAEWLAELKNLVLKEVGGHVIIVDWSKGAEFPNYYQAVANTELVGRMLARLVHRLIVCHPSALNSSKIHFIGHSLGAQMARFFSKYFKKISGNIPSRITALDAAGPVFEANGIFVNRENANFVEALHTSGGGSLLTGDFGILHPVGHVDFYPNGGRRQPGCTPMSFGCSHIRAHELYLESRNSSNCEFRSYSCSGGLAQYLQNKCVPEFDNWSVLGFKAKDSPGRGIQFFETGSQSPFCQCKPGVPAN